MEIDQLANFAAVGREHGKFLAGVFERDVLFGFGGSVPSAATDIYNRWRELNIAECMSRLRAAGCSHAEVMAWLGGCWAEQKERFTLLAVALAQFNSPELMCARPA